MMPFITVCMMLVLNVPLWQMTLLCEWKSCSSFWHRMWEPHRRAAVMMNWNSGILIWTKILCSLNFHLCSSWCFTVKFSCCVWGCTLFQLNLFISCGVVFSHFMTWSCWQNSDLSWERWIWHWLRWLYRSCLSKSGAALEFMKYLSLWKKEKKD